MGIFKNLFITSLVLLVSSFSLYSALPQDKTGISEENKQKLEEVKQMNSEADVLNSEADEYYKEIEIVDLGGASAFDSKIEKKVKKLKNKAYEKQIEAFEIQKDANKLEYEVYKDLVLNYLNTANQNDNTTLDLKLFEEHANEYFYRAEMLRSGAYENKKDFENVYKKLSEAQEFEELGLTKENQAYELTLSKEAKQSKVEEVSSTVIEDNYATEKNEPINTEAIVEETIPETIPETESTTIATETYDNTNSQQENVNIQDLKINEELLKDYLDYLSSSNIVDPVSIIESLNELNNFSAIAFRKAWYEYLYESEVIPSEVKTVLADSVANLEAELLAEKTNKIEQVKTEEQTVKATDNIVDNSEQSEDLLYRIEIAIDNQPISQGALQKIYNGEKVVNIINDGGWQKYCISTFYTYDEADKFRKGIPVRDAFIVSYKKAEIADVTPDVKGTTETKEVIDAKEEYTAVSDLIYKVQIAASRTPIPDRFLGQIYAESQDVDLIVEDGWYKYSVGSYKEYNPAVDSRKNIGVKNAFVVAYRNGKKVSLDVARGKTVPMYRNNIDVNSGDFPITEKLIYKVQIAASRKELSKEFLSKLYSDDKNIHVIQEDGWFRYSIGAYDNISEAIEARKQCGVNGAFVVSYKNGSKVNYETNNNFEPKLISDWPNQGNSIVFKIQIAASINKLTIPELKNICRVKENIYLIKEGVWYKYSIGNYTSFSIASENCEKTGVKGAFVVAYKNMQKLSINQAIGK